MLESLTPVSVYGRDAVITGRTHDPVRRVMIYLVTFNPQVLDYQPYPASDVVKIGEPPFLFGEDGLPPVKHQSRPYRPVGVEEKENHDG